MKLEVFYFLIFFIICRTNLLTLEQYKNFQYLEKELIKTDPKLAAPFEIYAVRLNNSIGFEIQLVMNSVLRSAGVRDIKFGAYFPLCSNVFSMYMDLTAWPNGKVHLSEMTSNIRLINI